jgi:hypothetical protein
MLSSCQIFLTYAGIPPPFLQAAPKALGVGGAAEGGGGRSPTPGVRVRPEGGAEGREGAQPPADLYRRASAPHFFLPERTVDLPIEWRLWITLSNAFRSKSF